MDQDYLEELGQLEADFKYDLDQVINGELDREIFIGIYTDAFREWFDHGFAVADADRISDISRIVGS